MLICENLCTIKELIKICVLNKCSQIGVGGLALQDCWWEFGLSISLLWVNDYPFFHSDVAPAFSSEMVLETSRKQLSFKNFYLF